MIREYARERYRNMDENKKNKTQKYARERYGNMDDEENNRVRKYARDRDRDLYRFV